MRPWDYKLQILATVASEELEKMMKEKDSGNGFDCPNLQEPQKENRMSDSDKPLNGFPFVLVLRKKRTLPMDDEPFPDDKSKKRKIEGEERMTLRKYSDDLNPFPFYVPTKKVRTTRKRALFPSDELIRHIADISAEWEDDDPPKVDEAVTKEIDHSRGFDLNTAQPELPLEFMAKIEEMGGYEIKLVIEKQLFKSDLSSYHNRLSIPENQIRREAIDFVRQEEVELLEQHVTDKRLAGMPVLVLDPCVREFNLILKKWKMTRCSVYNLIDQWSSIVQQNDLKPKDRVQLWSFRSHDDKLCFALIKLQQESVLKVVET